MPLTLRQRLVYYVAKILKVDYYTNPHKIEDDPNKVYVWVVGEGDRADFAEFIDHSFIEFKGTSPKALHMVVADIDQIKEIDAETYKSKIKPWLTQRNR